MVNSNGSTTTLPEDVRAFDPARPSDLCRTDTHMWMPGAGPGTTELLSVRVAVASQQRSGADFALLHEAVLGGTGERLAVGADGLGRAGVGLALLHE